MVDTAGLDVVFETVSVVANPDDTESVEMPIASVRPLEHLRLCSMKTTNDAQCYTGLRVYEGAEVLAAFIASAACGRDRLRGKSIVEIGCGCGLAGLVALRRGEPSVVCFTDGEPSTLMLVGSSVAALRDNDRSTAAHSGTEVVTRALVWNAQEIANFKRELGENSNGLVAQCARSGFDFVIGSELVYFRTYPAELAAVCAGLLAERGTLILSFVERFNGGAKSLRLALQEVGISAVFRVRLVSFLSEDVIFRRGWPRVHLWVGGREAEAIRERWGTALQLDEVSADPNAAPDDEPDAALPQDW